MRELCGSPIQTKLCGSLMRRKKLCGSPNAKNFVAHLSPWLTYATQKITYATQKTLWLTYATQKINYKIESTHRRMI